MSVCRVCICLKGELRHGERKQQQQHKLAQMGRTLAVLQPRARRCSPSPHRIHPRCEPSSFPRRSLLPGSQPLVPMQAGGGRSGRDWGGLGSHRRSFQGRGSRWTRLSLPIQQQPGASRGFFNVSNNYGVTKGNECLLHTKHLGRKNSQIPFSFPGIQLFRALAWGTPERLVFKATIFCSCLLMSVHLSCGLTHLLDDGFSSSLQKTRA